MIERTYFFPQGSEVDLAGFGNVVAGEGGLYITFRNLKKAGYLMDVRGVGYVGGEQVKLNKRNCETNSSFENWARINGQEKR